MQRCRRHGLDLSDPLFRSPPGASGFSRALPVGASREAETDAGSDETEGEEQSELIDEAMLSRVVVVDRIEPARLLGGGHGAAR